MLSLLLVCLVVLLLQLSISRLALGCWLPGFMRAFFGCLFGWICCFVGV